MLFSGIQLKNNIFLAPMAGITDAPFRILCKEMGCGLTFTEMVSAKGMHYGDAKSFQLTEIHEEEKPSAIQIFGSDPDIMAEIVEEQLNDMDAVAIDINMGCPVPKISKNGEGCALMKNPKLAEKIISKVVKVSRKPVSVKFRKGWDEENVNAVEFAKMVEFSGAGFLTVHGRTREQYYSGKADWDIIRRVKEAVRIPVVGNGDIFDAISAKKMFDETGCDAIMIGRGAQGNPWVFREILDYYRLGRLPEKPTMEERLNMIERHMDMMISLKGPHAGMIEMRKHIAWYIKGIRNCNLVKEMIFKTVEKEIILNILKEHLIEIDGAK